MKLAVLLMFCKDTPRVTTLTRELVYSAIDEVARYIKDQSNQHENLQFRVFPWVKLPFTSAEWDGFDFSAGNHVKPVVAHALGVDLTAFDHFALVMDKADSSGAAVAGDFIHIHVGAQGLAPSLIARQLATIFGAPSADRDSPNGPVRFGDPFCIMGYENLKYSFNHDALVFTENGALVTKHSKGGPGMTAPNLAACGWLNPAVDAEYLGLPLHWDSSPRRVTVRPLHKPWSTLYRAYARSDGIAGNEQITVEYRRLEAGGWDRAIPAGDWIVIHAANAVGQPAKCLQVMARNAVPYQIFEVRRAGYKMWIDNPSEHSVGLNFQRL